MDDAKESSSSSSEKCRLILRFLKPTTMYERVVAKIAGSPVHVDIVIDKPGTSSKAACYSAFMRERFSMTLMDQECMSNPSYVNRFIEISEEDADRCLAFLSKLANKVPYNYSDSMLLIPLLPRESELVDTMVPDVEAGKDPSKLSSVFCSQAAVLMCRECLAPSSRPGVDSLVRALSSINSRLASPAELFEIFSVHSKPITNGQLFCDRMRAPMQESPFSIQDYDDDDVAKE